MEFMTMEKSVIMGMVGVVAPTAGLIQDTHACHLGAIPLCAINAGMAFTDQVRNAIMGTKLAV